MTTCRVLRTGIKVERGSSTARGCYEGSSSEAVLYGVCDNSEP